jgi:RNA polymerase sigma factor (sigma-70 family)
MAVVISDRLLESKDRLLDAESDEQLVRLVHSGQEAAFAAIVRRYERELQAQARRLTSEGRGEDAVQQAFLNAFAALQRGAEIRHLRGWLHHILRNEVIRARVPVDAPLDAAVGYGETLEDTVQRRATIHATLAQLSAMPDRQRDALLATAVLGFPRAHVARTMGLSEGAVRQLVHRARLRLRQAASALIPFPLFKLFGAARSGMDASSDAALGAGAAASGGLAVKVGALVASGVVATGIAVTQTFPPRHHATSSARGARQHGLLTRAPARISPREGPSGAPNNPALVATSLRLDEHGLGATGAQGRSHGGPGRLSGAQSDDRDGPGSGRGRGDSRGLDESSTGPGDDGSGRLAGGSSGRGPSRGGSGSRSGPSSGAGSGDDGSTTRSGGSGSGSGSGRQSDSGSGTSGSGSGSGSGSRDGAHGSGSSGSDGGIVTTTDGDASAAALTGSSGATSTPPATTIGDVTSGQDGSSSGGSSSGGSGGSSGGSGSGDTESSGGSRDLSGSLDSSSS